MVFEISRLDYNCLRFSLGIFAFLIWVVAQIAFSEPATCCSRRGCAIAFWYFVNILHELPLDELVSQKASSPCSIFHAQPPDPVEPSC